MLVRVCTVNLTLSFSDKASLMSTINVFSGISDVLLSLSLVVVVIIF